jgi:hypothetical protein
MRASTSARARFQCPAAIHRSAWDGWPAYARIDLPVDRHARAQNAAVAMFVLATSQDRVSLVSTA